MAEKPSKAELEALRVQAAAARVAAIEAASAQSQLLAQAKLAGAEARNAAVAQAAVAKAATDAAKASQQASIAAERLSASQSQAALAALRLAQAQAKAQAATEGASQAALKKANDAAAKSAAQAQKDNLARMKRDQDAAAKHAELLQKHEADKVRAAKAAADAQTKAGKDTTSLLTRPIDVITEKLEMMGPKGAIAAQAIKVGFAAVAAAVTVTIGTIIALGAAAISVVQQRSQLLATFAALSGGAAGGAKTLAIVEKLGVALPFATSQIAEWATGLQKVGFQGRALESAIKAVGAAQALMGASGAAAAQSLLEKLGRSNVEAQQFIQQMKGNLPEARSQLAEMGLRIEDVAAAMGKTVAQFRNSRVSAKELAGAIEKALARKAAGPLADLMLGFPNIIGKAKEGFLSLFSKLGPAVKPFMGAVKALFGEFSKGGAVTRFLLPIVTKVFTALFGVATRAVVAVRAVMLALIASGKQGGIFGGAIAVLRGGWTALAAIFKVTAAALRPIVLLLKTIFSNAMVLKGIRTLFTWLATGIVLVVTVLGTLIAAIAAFTGLIAGAVGIVTGAVSGIAGAIVAGLSSIDLSAFIQSVVGAANAALTGFKAVFGIASPSKVMAQMGGHLTEGAAQGVDDGAGDVQKSMDKMVSPKAPAAAKGKSGAGVTNTFNNCTFGARSQDEFDSWMNEWWSRKAAEVPT